MSILRKSMITALVAGAVLTAPSAALAATSQHAASSMAASAVTKVHRAPCAGLTFNVYHNHLPTPICYAGTGTISPRIQGVYRITTGEYWGCLGLLSGKKRTFASFHPEEAINLLRPAELVALELARHPVVCPQ
jgi:hypothetical protein